MARVPGDLWHSPLTTDRFASSPTMESSPGASPNVLTSLASLHRWDHSVWCHRSETWHCPVAPGPRDHVPDDTVFVDMAFRLETGTINKEGKSQENLAPAISIPSNKYLACTFCFSCRTQAIWGCGCPYKWRHSFLILLLNINPWRETGYRQPENYPFPLLSTF